MEVTLSSLPGGENLVYEVDSKIERAQEEANNFTFQNIFNDIKTNGDTIYLKARVQKSVNVKSYNIMDSEDFHEIAARTDLQFSIDYAIVSRTQDSVYLITKSKQVHRVDTFNKEMGVHKV